jgi:glyoxylase-like metal-dependent hydrolase (beta-lactamase superfamily II)
MSSQDTATGLYRFNTADWTLDYSMLVQIQQPGEPYDVTCPCYLVEHPEGTVLFDTGVSYEMATDPENYGHHGAPHMAEFVQALDIDESRGPVAQLADIGYEPSDVDYVVMSHLHTDHAGNMSEFPDAEFLVHEDELQYAWWPTATAQQLFYVDGDLEALRRPEFDVTSVHGRYDVFGDGSVEIVPTPGHSPGHQSLRVDLPDAGTVILAGDVANHRAGYEQELAASFNWSVDDSIESMRAVREEARVSDADVFLHHDRDDQSRLPDPPEKLT